MFVTSAFSCLSWCSSSLLIILPWSQDVSIIASRSSCQITSTRPCIFRLFSRTKFTCPLSGCKPSFLHILVNSSSSSTSSSRPGTSTVTAPTSPSGDFLPSVSPLSSSSSSPSLSSPELSDTSAAERAGKPAFKSSGLSSEDKTVIISMDAYIISVGLLEINRVEYIYQAILC